MLSDLRLTLRMLAKSPGFVAVAVFTLALGLGVNTAMFSIVNAILFRGLPYPESHRLQAVILAHPERGQPRLGHSWLDYQDLRAAQTSFTDLAAYQTGTFNVSGGDLAPERFVGLWMNGPGFELLGVPVVRGRWWTPEEAAPGAPPVVVISDRLWRTRYGARPDILGQSVKINGEFMTVIGVGPAEFDFPAQCDLWAPRPAGRAEEKRDNRYLALVGRLKPGVTPGEARREFAALGERLAEAHPDTNAGYVIHVKPLIDQFIGNDVRPLLTLMSGAVSLVLLIACANVANLLLARGGSRAREVAVRAALGASRSQVVRLLLLESLALAVLGALAGLPLAWGLLELFAYAMAVSGDTQPAWLQWTMDGNVAFYVLGAVVFACIGAGLVPALRLARPNLTDVLKDGTRGSTGGRFGRFTRALVIAEVAFSCVLLVMSGLMIRTVMAAGRIELGYRPEGVFVSRVGLPETQTPAQQADFFRRLAENLAARPDVAASGLAFRLPTQSNRDDVTLEGHRPAGAATRPQAGNGTVTPGWFDVLGVKVSQGRDFDARDTADSERVAIVNTRLAETFWPGENPLGRRLKLGDEKKSVDQPWITVVGVVSTFYQGSFDEPAGPQIYLPQTQSPNRFMSLFVRGMTNDPAANVAILRAEVSRLDPDLPLYWPKPLQESIDEARFFPKLFASIFGIFGGVALVLAAVGLYGVMAYSVAQRTQEIGVRMALGAQPREVVGLILRQGGWQIGLGLAVGLGLAFFAGRLLAFVLFGVAPGDPPTFVSTLVVLGGTGFVACLVPALRALRISPMRALRAE